MSREECEKRDWNSSPGRIPPGTLPQGGSIVVDDVTHDFALCPTVAGRLLDGALRRAEHRHWAAPPSDGDGFSKPFDLAEASEAFSLELRRTQYALLHDSDDN